MKKRSLTTLSLIVTLTLVQFLNISAQQNDGAGKSKDSATLQKSLDELGQRLKESVAIDHRQGYVKRTYVRLKRRGGCNIGFQVSQVPSGAYVREPYKPASDLGYAEWNVDLSDLDSAAVRIETPAKGDYRVIHFSTIGGKESIKWKGFSVENVGWVSGVRIDISEKSAPQVAAALENAIIACRQ